MKKIFNKKREQIFNIVNDNSKDSFANKAFNITIMLLIVLNVIMVIVDTVSGLPLWIKKTLLIIELTSIIIFTIEYILRLWTAIYIYPHLSHTRARLRYVFSYMALIDLLAILPFYLPFIFTVDLRILRMIRLSRLLRVMKVNRYSNSLHTLSNVLKKKSPQLISSTVIVSILIIISAVTMFNLEHKAQPTVFKNLFSSIWWAIATLTTVGYGDIYPITPFGKILSGLIAILGIGLVAIPTGIISSGFMESISKEKEEKEEKYYCPYCGKRID